MNQEQKTIEHLERTNTKLRAENSKLETNLAAANQSANDWEKKCRKAELDAINAIQHAKLADEAIKAMQYSQDLLNAKIEKLSALQTLKPV
jgi:phage shock protein A